VTSKALNIEKRREHLKASNMEFRGQDEEQHKQVYVLCRMQIRE